MTDPTPHLLATPLTDEAPCGENLEYDPQFLALELAARGKPEVQYGSAVVAATAPDWPAVRALALALMARSRDLRVAVILVRSQLALDGFAGFADGLDLLRQLLLHWEHVHPQLDPDDGFDPLLRMNTLAMLVEPGGMLQALREAPLVAVRALGAFSLRDIERAQEEGAEPTPAVIDAAFGAADSAELAATHEALADAAATVHAIEAVLAGHLADGAGLDLGPLSALLRRAVAALQPHLTVAPGADAPAPDGVQAQAPARGATDIASRDDVVRVLDRVCAWYATHEPSSPVPLLLGRARNLVDKNFTQLLEDLAPDGLAQLTQISGIRHAD